jgi:hypothetical protein
VSGVIKSQNHSQDHNELYHPHEDTRPPSHSGVLHSGCNKLVRNNRGNRNGYRESSVLSGTNRLGEICERKAQNSANLKMNYSTNADRSSLHYPDKALLSTALGTPNIPADGDISQSWGLQGEEIFSMEENKDFYVFKAALPTTSPTAVKGDYS